MSKHKHGDFKATCRTGAYLPTDDLTEPERAWAAEEDARQAEAGEYRDVYRWDKRRKVETVRVECHLDTTDRAEYLEHMARVHGRKTATWEASSPTRSGRLAASTRKPWRAPKLEDEGTPFKPSNKAVAEAVETCPSCGLVAEIRGVGFGRNADELWWREHVSMCTGTEAVA